MTERRLKGGVIIGYLDFIKRQWGQEGLDQCVGDIKLDADSIMAETFYPSEINDQILRWISREKGMEFVKKTGNHAVKNLGSLAYLVRFVNIKHLLKKAKENYADKIGRASCRERV